MNNLTRDAGLKLGPIILETLVKHYFERVLKDGNEETANQGKQKQLPLMQQELLYDEAFTIVKRFLEQSTYHTIEDVQGFSNTRTPSPPWVHVVRLVIPLSCCDDASVYLIKALGGEDAAKRLVGGTKWWQVRGIKGVNAQWVIAKKDWREAQRRHKAQEKRTQESSGDQKAAAESSANPEENEQYHEGMDEMRCILYSHGGGYFFGSVDQERYSIQRHARKINGRVFAVDYRLAPQYPFPCALHDLLSAYLYLIKPPSGAKHTPVKPEHIVIAGDSAGGGLSLALLQVIRDTGLPMPAGGVLISPWCDFTHSFPSIHTNGPTDVIPPYGLSLQKPSTLWPPPPGDFAEKVQSGLRARIRQVMRTQSHNDIKRQGSSGSRRRVESNAAVTSEALKNAVEGSSVNVGTNVPPPTDPFGDKTFRLTAQNGQLLEVPEQVHFYTENHLLGHPLVSPALSYLGGLPPLLFIAGEAEVLRDEIIYTAHKAAHPDKYPAKPTARDLYPSLDGIEKRFGPTPVHLQVYDDAAHVLPVLFSFTTPGKYCYRSIASFIKHVTGMTAPAQEIILPGVHPGMDSPPSTPGISTPTPTSPSFRRPSLSVNFSRGDITGKFRRPRTSPSNSSLRNRSEILKPHAEDSANQNPTAGVRRSASGLPVVTKSTWRSSLNRRSTTTAVDTANDEPNTPVGDTVVPKDDNSADVAGPRFALGQTEEPSSAVRYAGESIVYSENEEFPSMKEKMIRERVSIRGEIRPLEPEEELPAFTLKPDDVGVLSELTLRRYIEGRDKFNQKFATTIHHIDRHRTKNLNLAKRNANRNMAQLQAHLFSAGDNKSSTGSTQARNGHGAIADGLLAASGSWSWAWALDTNERPPPSSIVSRRDTAEALQLAHYADQSFVQGDSRLSGNNLWSVIVNFLTTTPDKSGPSGADADAYASQQHASAQSPSSSHTSFFKRFQRNNRHVTV